MGVVDTFEHGDDCGAPKKLTHIFPIRTVCTVECAVCTILLKASKTVFHQSTSAEYECISYFTFYFLIRIRNFLSLMTLLAWYTRNFNKTLADLYKIVFTLVPSTHYELTASTRRWHYSCMLLLLRSCILWTKKEVLPL